jgi:hypothetical protein
MRRWIGWVVALATMCTGLAAQGRTPDDVDWYWVFAGIANSTGAVVEWDGGGRERLTFCPWLPAKPGAGWVMAVPAAAETVKVAWVEGPPQYRGLEPRSVVHGDLDRVIWWASMTQGYPVVWEIFRPPLGYTQTLPAAGERTRGGLEWRLVAAKDPETLAREMRQAGVELPEGERRRLERCVDGQHSFLIVSIASREAYLPRGELFREGPAIEVRFPTAHLLLPARAIGGQIDYLIEDNVAVAGWVSVTSGRGVNRLRHFVGRSSGQGQRGSYTRLKRTGPPEAVYFQADPDAGWTYRWVWWLSRWSVRVPLWVVWTALCSYVSGGVAGLIAARRWREYARVGLWNLLTILGLLVAVKRTRGLDRMREYWPRRAFVVVFSVVFVGINAAATWALWLLMGRYTESWW